MILKDKEHDKKVKEIQGLMQNANIGIKKYSKNSKTS
jgi:hypothetical protein